MAQANKATYLEKDSLRKLSKRKASPFTFWLASAFAFLLLVLVGAPLASAQLTNTAPPSLVTAGGIACNSPLGYQMDSKGNWGDIFSSPIYGDLPNRTFTLQEIVSGVAWTNYHGVGEGDGFWVGNYDEVSRAIPEETRSSYGNYEQVQDKLTGSRDFWNCTVNDLMISGANMSLGVSSWFSGLTGSIATAAFNTNIICPADNSAADGGFCIDLLKIIGGREASDDGGIIGALTSSIYLPLVLIAVTLVGLWVLYTGIVKRKVREALFGAIWLALSFIVGLMLLLNPQLLVKAPMEAGNIAVSCVVGALSGDNCFDGSATNSNVDVAAASDAICISDASGVTPGQKMAMSINALNCGIWKAFVLQPYAQGAFGVGLDSLDTSNPQLAAVIDRAGIDPQEFCITLRSTGSANDFEGRGIQFSEGSGTRICNLAVYQLYLSGPFSTSTSDLGAMPSPDPDWYNVIVTAAHDDGLWNQWSGTPTGNLHKFGVAALSVLTTGVGSVLIIFVAVMALVYYLSAVVLIAFAPIFFLMGVHPGRGKKMLFGWFEQVLSGILKYLASAIFLVIAIIFYSAILSSVDNIAYSFIFVLLLSVALFVYRKEIINLIGRANLGGEKLSSSLAEKASSFVNNVGDRTGRLATGAVGGAIGAGYAARGTGDFAQALKSGAVDGIKRDLKRNTGIIGNAARQLDRASIDNKQVLDKRRKAASDAQPAAAKAFEDTNERFELATADLQESNSSYTGELDNIEVMNERLAAHGVAVTHAVADSRDPEKNEGMAISQEYGQFQEILSRLENLTIQHRIATANGDTEAANNLAQEIAQQQVARDQIMEDFKSRYASEEAADRAWQQDEDLYRSNYEHVAGRYIKTQDPETGHWVAAEYNYDDHLQSFDNLSNHADSIARNQERLRNLSAQQDSTYQAMNEASVAAEIYTREYEDWMPGDTITSKDLEDIEVRVNQGVSELSHTTPASVEALRATAEQASNVQHEKVPTLGEYRPMMPESYGEYLPYENDDDEDGPRGGNLPLRDTPPSGGSSGGASLSQGDYPRRGIPTTQPDYSVPSDVELPPYETTETASIQQDEPRAQMPPVPAAPQRGLPVAPRSSEETSAPYSDEDAPLDPYRPMNEQFTPTPVSGRRSSERPSREQESPNDSGFPRTPREASRRASEATDRSAEALGYSDETAPMDPYRSMREQAAPQAPPVAPQPVAAPVAAPTGLPTPQARPGAGRLPASPQSPSEPAPRREAPVPSAEELGYRSEDAPVDPYRSMREQDTPQKASTPPVATAPREVTPQDRAAAGRLPAAPKNVPELPQVPAEPREAKPVGLPKSNPFTSKEKVQPSDSSSKIADRLESAPRLRSVRNVEQPTTAHDAGWQPPALFNGGSARAQAHDATVGMMQETYEKAQALGLSQDTEAGSQIVSALQDAELELRNDNFGGAQNIIQELNRKYGSSLGE